MGGLRGLTGAARDRLPAGVGATLRRIVGGWGWLTADLRMEPAFLVVGAQRCGTTTLFRLLSEHPDVVRPTLAKGIGYFDMEHGRGMRWYRGHFPVARLARRGRRRGARVAFESSGYYCYHPLAPQRIGHDLPGVRVVMLVRDPVERAWSAYKHEVARGFETEDFSRALDLEPERLAGEVDRIRAEAGYRSYHHRHHSYLARGRYAEQVSRLRDALGPDRVMVADAGAFFADPDGEFTAITDFLGLRRWSPQTVPRANARPGDLEPELRARLTGYFEPYDADLAKLVGWTPTWRQISGRAAD